MNAVGSAVAAKNKDALGVRPVFFTMGVPEVEISHKKSGMVIISEGLVERCPTDTELAAVLCDELGKIAAEQPANREADRESGRRPFTRDVVGGTYEPDMTRLAEEAKFDRRGPRPRARPAATSGRSRGPWPRASSRPPGTRPKTSPAWKGLSARPRQRRPPGQRAGPIGG